MFGKKVTLTKEDYDILKNTAKKYVSMVKSTKKLKAEHDTAVRERDKLKIQLSAVSSELTEYKKKEEEKRYFSREKLNKDAHRISTEEQLRNKLSKALTVIDRYGLREEYERAKPDSLQRKSVLE